MRWHQPKRTLLILGLVTAAVASTATAAVVQSGDLRLTVLGQVLPFKLPRDHVAPVAVFIAGHVGTVGRSVPPQLQKMVVDVNRHGQLRPQGIPTCTIRQIQPGTTARALANCGDALVGSGRFWASVILPEQRPYRTRGRLLVFNGKRHGAPVLFAHIFTSQPFNNSFVITFGIERENHGLFGTRLTADFPEALGSWGFVDRIKLTLRRKFSDHGRIRSYFNASCPAPPGARITSFPLAKASFFFAGMKPVSLDVVKTCGVEE
ncbi:MAG TPA: hypothetical protein VFN18_06725 [Solirubrobacterales bacterium]|nr:hypothetical protein [Solirubrobacterales bacterium]